MSALPKAVRVLAILTVLPALAGCGSLLTEGSADAAGVAGAGIAGAVTKDATLGAAIGLGVRSVADAGLRYAERRVHAAEQDRIAAAGGALEPGAVGVWSVTHDIPIEDDAHGSVAVVRGIGNAAFDCREIVFSVETGTGTKLRRGFYVATICRDGGVWRWASAEPATPRWGSLQ